MEFRRKVIAGVSLGLVMVLAALASTGCGGSSSGKPSARPASSTASPSASSSSEQQAAKAYFAVMAPVIDRDYQAFQWFNQTMSQWQQTYATGGPPTSRKAWDAFGSILQRLLHKQEEIAKGYETITPPVAFQRAHATLVKGNREAIPWDKALLALIKARRPIGKLVSMLKAGPPGPPSSEVVIEFRDAAARVGIEVPPKLIEVYSN